MEERTVLTVGNVLATTNDCWLKPVHPMPDISQYAKHKNRFYSYHKAVTHDHWHKKLSDSDKQIWISSGFCMKQSKTVHFIYLAYDDSKSYQTSQMSCNTCSDESAKVKVTSNHMRSCSTVNKIKQLTLSNPIYNRLVQRRNLCTPFVHATVTRNTGRLLVQFQ